MKRLAECTIIIIGLFLGLIYGKELLIILFTGGLLAFLMLPLCTLFERYIPSRTVATSSAVTLIAALVLVISSVMVQQLAQLVQQISIEKVKLVLQQIPGYLETLPDIGLDKAIATVMDQLALILQWIMSNLLMLVGNIFNWFFILITAFVYSFFLLVYRKRIQKILHVLTPDDDASTRVVKQLSGLIPHYLLGLSGVVGIVAILTTVGLWLLGIPNAFVLGLLAGFGAPIPYIGVLLSSIPPLVSCLVTESPLWSALGVLVLFIVVQALEGNFFTPYFVGSSMTVHPLAVMLAVTIGGYVWGISGMILFVPLIGIIYIVCSTVERLKPYGELLRYER